MSHDWLRSFRTVSLLTVLSRITGYMRDGALGLWIGPGVVLDSFLVVTRIASMGRAFFAEGMVNAMVPTLALELDLDEQKKLVFAIASRVMIVLMLLCTFVSFNPKLILGVIAPGFQSDERIVYASSFLAVMFWYLFQMSVISMMNAMLNLKGRFALTAFLPCMLNVMLIIATVGIGLQNWPFISLAYAVIVAGFIQMIAVAIMLRKTVGKWQHCFQWQHPGVRNLLQVLTGAFASTGAVQCSTLLDTILATSLGSGAVSWVYYSDRLVQLPLGILGVSMMTVLLPKLSQQHANSENDDYVATFALGLESMLMLGVPIMLFLLVLGEEVVCSLFGYGKFTSNDVLQTGLCLRWMSMALPAIMVGKLIAASSFAKRNVTGLMQASIIGLVCNGVFAWSMRHCLQQQAMAIGMLLGSWANVLWLFRVSSPLTIGVLWHRCRLKQWIMVWLVWALGLMFMQYLVQLGFEHGPLERIMRLGLMGMPVVVFYLLACLAMWFPSYFRKHGAR